jgi:Transposase DDE domain
MSRQRSWYSKKALNQWTAEVTAAFPELSKPQVTGLAWWSFGMVLAKSCALTAVVFFLAKLLAFKVRSLSQRLREFYQEAPAKSGSKRGGKRQQLEVSTCFAPLLRWVLKGWPNRQLAVAVDASTLGELFTVLCISVVYRGSAIPVAWKIMPALAKGSWKEPWLALLTQFQGVVPEGWTVMVLGDRGLWANWLFEGIRKLGWHPLLRINKGGTFRPQGWVHFVPLTQLAPQVGSRWRGRGTAFSTPSAQLECTLWAFWEEGHEEAWLLLTDLPPSGGDARWYGLRSWIEQFFKDSKRGGWQWQRTRMTDPARAERLWLALAVATLWLQRVGGAEEQAEAPVAEPAWGVLTQARQERPRTRRWRLLSVLQRGWVAIMVALLNHARLPLGRWLPEPWPVVPELPGPAAANAGVRRVA